MWQNVYIENKPSLCSELTGIWAYGAEGGFTEAMGQYDKD